MIEFSQVTKTYEDQDALKQLSLTINDGELFVLVGPSGSGKTTLLKTVNRLIVPTSGSVAIDGTDVSTMDLEALRRHTGYVLQAGALFLNMTVGQNAGIQLEALGWPADRRQTRIAELLQEVDLAPDQFMSRFPSELSGGEAQRVGIVRALAADPKLILMDEPFSALDPLSKRQLQALILKLHRDLATTFVFVTHDMREAVRLADRLAVIHNGVLQQVGEPRQILSAPANDFVREFFADEGTQSQFLQQVVASGWGNQATAATTATPLAGSKTIYQWAALVKASPTQNIVVADHVLTPQDLVSYMASLAEEA